MTTRNALTLCALLALSSSCKKDDLGPDGDGGATGSHDSAAAQAVLSIQEIPPAVVLFGYFAAVGEPDGCPAVEQGENTVRIVGGCTDSHGDTYTGEMTISNLNAGADETGLFEIDGFGVSGSEGAFELTGTITTGMDDEDPLSADLEGSLRIADGASYSFALSNYVANPVGDLVNVLIGGDAGSYTLSADLSVDGVDNFALSSSVSADGTCGDEPGAGDLTLTGEVADIVYSYDGDSGCDGCIPWTSGTESGSICFDGRLFF